jgi:2-hydroxy-6-oxonona-2,4-dienedioate hydrolase/2-hydroxy-6-oxo-6-(2'-carboxyphenyl)-hexa-2,4-dienoate hydrolase
MAQRLELARPAEAKPLEDWPPVSVELLGTQTRIVQGKRWHHRIVEAGDGDPLLLLHGIGGHAETWARNLHNLGRHFHVYAVDMVFHGLSGKEGWDSARWVQLQADGLVDLLDALGHDWAHVEGESLGAEVAFDLAARYPDRVRKLIMNTGLVEVRDPDAPPAADEPDSEDVVALKKLSHEAVLRPTFDTLRKRLQWLVHGEDRMTDEMVMIRQRLYETPDVAESMRRVYRVDEPWDMGWEQVDADMVAGLKHDTLVFWTEHNPGAGPADGEAFADLLPNAVFYNMADAAHWPQWEKPEEHDQVLIEFITGVAT